VREKERERQGERRGRRTRREKEIVTRITGAIDDDDGDAGEIV
jgi:hypothetical protein